MFTSSCMWQISSPIETSIKLYNCCGSKITITSFHSKKSVIVSDNQIAELPHTSGRVKIELMSDKLHGCYFYDVDLTKLMNRKDFLKSNSFFNTTTKCSFPLILSKDKLIYYNVENLSGIEKISYMQPVGFPLIPKEISTND